MRSSLAPSPLLVCLGVQLLSPTLSAVPPTGAEAEPDQSPPPATPGEYPVDFSAGRVEVDVRLNELELADDVVVVVDRYRLTANQLKLSRSDRGIVVDGDGRVAFCPCADPPVTLGFSSATVAPPTDLLIEDPTLRVGGVPVLWLPYLWLRAPDRVGLLPPRVAYSTEDGWLAGSGVHLPFDSGSAFLDLEAAGYFKGGVDARMRLATPHNRLRLRIDHLKHTMLGLDARGVAHVPGLSSAAYRVDAIRGERALDATPILLDAAQRYDRARAELGRHHGTVYYGVGASMTAQRGGALSELGAVGPALSLGAGEAIGSIGDVALGLGMRTVETSEQGALSLLEQRVTARLHARPGPLAAELELGERAGLTSTQLASDRFLALGAGFELGVPLRRRFGGADPLVHTLTPLVSTGGELVLETDDVVFAQAADPSVGQLSAGLRTAIGRWGAKSALQLEARAGWARDETQSERLLAAELLGQAEYFAASAKVVTAAEHGGGWVAASRMRLGPGQSHHLTVYAEGERELDPELGRAMSGDVLSNEPRLAWYDAPGLSSGGELMLRWSRSLSSALAGDFDVDQSELLGVRGSLAYRHPCGCLATVAWAGHRLSRQGVDAWLTVDLIP